ncbi:Fe-S cluster assembly protein SufB [Thermoplasmatales archaeon SW_10_69_26]|nr:MAG: Fe-S cluster assembly protein SufB [Thermoplasmatales archaeon SW_10_69_26]
MTPPESKTIEEIADEDYEHGWSMDIPATEAPKGLNEEIVEYISEENDEPEWLKEWRLKAYNHWTEMEEPDWPNVEYPPIDFQDMKYYSAPEAGEEEDAPESLDEVDDEILEMYERLGIPLGEQKRLQGVAVDAVVDSVSVATTFKEELEDMGVIFCPISEAVQDYPDIVKKHLGSVVPITDNFYATLNSAVFSDGSFCYVPEGVECPLELSTYFRMNAEGTGQFERTLIVAEPDSYVSYLEGCTAPARRDHQLHAAVVELIAKDNAEIKYSTVQNWYPGDEEGEGGVYNFVTKRGKAAGRNSKISWAQVETGSAITWKYPSCILAGDGSVGEFYSVAITSRHQQADTGTKMIHLGDDTSSTIISKSISADQGQNTYRGQVKINEGAENARNRSECDSMLIGDECGAHTFPYIDVENPTAQMEHEATTTKIGEDQMFYLEQRGLDEEDAVRMIVNGFAEEVLDELPMEFAVEARNLLGIKLEGSVG